MSKKENEVRFLPNPKGIGFSRSLSIRDNLVEDTPRDSDLADDVWNAVAIGTETWKTLKRIK